jgi:hypothetical protein
VERWLAGVGPDSGHVSRGLSELAQPYVVHLAQFGAKFVDVKHWLKGRLHGRNFSNQE